MFIMKKGAIFCLFLMRFSEVHMNSFTHYLALGFSALLVGGAASSPHVHPLLMRMLQAARNQTTADSFAVDQQALAGDAQRAKAAFFNEQAEKK
jgi:hypothetical protein